MARRYNISAVLMLALMMLACSEPLPRSGGRPYDVAVVSSDVVSGRIVMRGMSECTEQFTSEEAMFQTSLFTDCEEDDVIRLARTLIIVDTADIENTTAIRERNVWARPQLVLYVRTPSAKQLTKDFNELRQLFAQEINDFERGLVINDIARHRNITLTDSVAKYTGTEMLIPAAMKIAEAKRDFIWLTSNSADENISLCVYRTLKKNVDVNDMKSITAFRDSVMKSHVRGARQDMFWQITPGTECAECRNDTTIIKNRWDINGDAMGGTSVCRILQHGDSVTFADAFLYAPASSKRDKMRRAEGILFSIKARK